MDHEQLVEQTEEADRKKQAHREQEEKNQIRLERCNTRRSERLVPYGELCERNQAVFERVEALASVLPPTKEPNNGYPHSATVYTAAIILGSAPVTQATPDHVLAVKVSASHYTHNDQPRERASFDFMSVEREVAETIQANPIDRDVINLSSYVDLAYEYTYVGGMNNEILELGNEHVSGYAFTPIRAIHRAKNIHEISERLDTLETTMGMVEGAAYSTELNPILSGMLESDAAAQCSANA